MNLFQLTECHKMGIAMNKVAVSKIFLCMFFALSAQNSFALDKGNNGPVSEYHVATTGDDGHSGATDKPLRTISAASKLAQPGDTITVHQGVYRERISPLRGGTSDAKRITYRAAQGETVEIKGSEKVTGWQRAENDSWKLELGNSFFGDFNPYNDEISGHWFYPLGMPTARAKQLNIKPRKHHTGAVYMNGVWLKEAASLNDVLELVGKTPEWYAKVTDTHTTIWAQFPGVDPNQELTEINVRQTIFFPEETGRNYITVKGFTMRHAATPWAAPTQKQMGMIGPHWSKGWIIEDNIISHAMTVCVQLGIKDMGVFKGNVEGFNAILRLASESGEWTKEKVGSHIIRRNKIHDCGAAGVNGSMGGSFSLIEENHIFDIHRDSNFSGLEQGGIKLHAAIDTVIRNNVIYRAGQSRARGIWLDWLGQGAVIEGNICFDNETADLYLEVTHGPTLVANNVFLSKKSIVSTARGSAFVNNYIAGNVYVGATTRKTPYAEPHSTKLIALKVNKPLDDRFLNNIFAGKGPALVPGFGGVKKEDLPSLPFMIENNLYLAGAEPSTRDVNPVVMKSTDQLFALKLSNGHYSLDWDLDKVWLNSVNRKIVTSQRLGLTHVGKHSFQYKDGSPVVVNHDLLGKKRNALNTMPGPIETSGKGSIKLN